MQGFASIINLENDDSHIQKVCTSYVFHVLNNYTSFKTFLPQ